MTAHGPRVPPAAGRAPFRAVAAAVLLVLLAACGTTYETDPHAVLQEGRAAVDHAAAIHFHVDSANAGGVDLYIRSGDGDAVRPNGFTGTFQIGFHGLNVDLGVVSLDGTFYAKLPVRTAYQAAKPSEYGFQDPGKLIDPSTGLTNLLDRATSPTMADRDRLDGEELYEVDCIFPAALVQQLLTDADTTVPVHGRVSVAVGSHEVRRVTLTGPLLQKGHDSTYTLRLSNYGEVVSVTPPPH